MNKKTWLAVIIIFFLSLMAFPPDYEQVNAQEVISFTIPWSVMGSGGMGGGADGYTINSTLGQPVAGVVDASGYHLTSGFWTRLEEILAQFLNFLPMIIR